jgi:cell division protein FtsQ
MERPSFVASLDHALGRLGRPIVDLVPRRLRRAAEKLEQEKRRPIGQMAAAGFLFAAFIYALAVGGEIGRLTDSLLVFAGFGINDVKISGEQETSELTILEKLDIAGSLVGYDIAAAQKQLTELPWVEKASVRKFYPGTLSVAVTERQPFALWQRDGKVMLIDREGTPIVPLDESRFAKLPLMVGGGANQTAHTLLADLLKEPAIAGQMRAAVLVADRRWDLYLDNGVTVKLPEKHVREALALLVKLDREKQLLSRDVAIVDLRLPDRVTVRLPEGRSLKDVTSWATVTEKRART